MDKAKLRLMAGVTGGIFGLASLAVLSFALVVALSHAFGLVWGATIVGAVYATLAVVGIFTFILPYKKAEEEIEQLENATADALADLPFDTVKSIVERHPLGAVGIAALAGFAATRDPESAIKQAERMMMGLL